LGAPETGEHFLVGEEFRLQGYLGVEVYLFSFVRESRRGKALLLSSSKAQGELLLPGLLDGQRQLAFELGHGDLCLLCEEGELGELDFERG